jgi:hypothetical protein
MPARVKMSQMVRLGAYFEMARPPTKIGAEVPVEMIINRSRASAYVSGELEPAGGLCIIAKPI